MVEKKKLADTGLAGMIAGESNICTVGLGNGLNYRGYNINELIKGNCSFEEVIYLLVVGFLPT
jgi:2-methylcitrate synthase